MATHDISLYEKSSPSLGLFFRFKRFKTFMRHKQHFQSEMRDTKLFLTHREFVANMKKNYTKNDKNVKISNFFFFFFSFQNLKNQIMTTNLVITFFPPPPSDPSVLFASEHSREWKVFAVDDNEKSMRSQISLFSYGSMPHTSTYINLALEVVIGDGLLHCLSRNSFLSLSRQTVDFFLNVFPRKNWFSSENIKKIIIIDIKWTFTIFFIHILPSPSSFSSRRHH